MSSLPDSPPSAALRLTLSAQALVSNWRWLAKASGRAACGAAIKADGYGLGARAVAARLAAAGCRDFFVATWAEAAALGPLGEGVRLGVFHGARADDMPAALALPGVRPVLNSPAQVARWKAEGGGRPCDVMVDTGMNRLGLTPEEARSGLLDGLALDTLMSHLACADEPGNPMNERQLFTFRMVKGLVPARRYSLANSAGICLGQRYAFSLTRPGLALYGGVPVPGAAAQEQGLAQVARIEAEVLQVRDVPAGATVGYGAAWTAQEPSRIAILNIGYADGYLRALGASGTARLGERAFPIIGRISMDLIAVATGDAPVREGDWLELPYALPETARRSGLSQYELLTALGRRYQRRWL